MPAPNGMMITTKVVGFHGACKGGWEGLKAAERASKGVFGGPSGPSREGPGVGHKIVLDTKQMTKEKKKKKKWVGKGENV